MSTVDSGGLRHGHRLEQTLRHQHIIQHQTYNHSGHLASVLAQQPLEVLLHGMERFVDLILGKRIQDRGDKGYQESDSKEPQGDCGTSTELHDFVILECVRRHLDRDLDPKTQRLLIQLALRIVDPFQENEEILEIQRQWSKNSTSKTGYIASPEDYGRLLLPLDQVRDELDLDDSALSDLRELLASRFLPIGLGWRSMHEYRYFLARHVFFADCSWVRETWRQEMLSFRLKAIVEHELGKQAAHSLFEVLVNYTKKRLIQYDSGRKLREPRSSDQIAERMGVDIETAYCLFHLYNALPDSPILDLGLIPYTRTLRKDYWLEAQVFWDDSQQRYVSRWHGRLGDRIEAIERANIEHKISLLKIAIAQARDQDNDIESVLDAVKRKHNYAGLQDTDLDEIADLTDRFLVAAGEDELVRECLRIESRLYGSAVVKTNTAKRRRLMDRLESMSRVYRLLQEECEYKPRLIEYIVNYQKGYLHTKDVEKLRPLTKAQVVEALGCLPGGGPSDGLSEEERKRKNLGRRLERYMARISIQLENGSVIPLESLIPGPGGKKDRAGNELVIQAIIDFIQEIIDSEPDRVTVTRKSDNC